MAHTFAKPILDNKAEFRAHWPKAEYGDIGDPRHQQGTGDHTPNASDVIFGMRHKRGVVYAQDLGHGHGFDQALFTRWLLDCLRGGAYREVKYVISRHPANKGVAGGRYFGLFDRRYSWRTQRNSGHDKHIHISYMPGSETTTSRIVADYWDGLHPTTPDPVWLKWAKAPALPAYALGRYSPSKTFATLPHWAWPPIVGGYGGADAPAQADFVRALHEYAIGQCRTTMIPPAEKAKAEIGPGTIAWARMVVVSLARNPWTGDPVRNGRALGASLGAPKNW